MNDDVNFPSHYTSGDVESIDAIWASGHGVGFCIGSAQKYLFRAGKKGDNPIVKDLRKAKWYLEFLLSKLDKDSADPREERESPDPERLAELRGDRVWIYAIPDEEFTISPFFADRKPRWVNWLGQWALSYLSFGHFDRVAAAEVLLSDGIDQGWGWDFEETMVRNGYEPQDAVLKCSAGCGQLRSVCDRDCTIY